MAKIDNNVALAFANSIDKTFGNTVVKDRAVYLHGNKIAWVSSEGLLNVTHCGWVTRTTMVRLNAILHAFGTGVTVSIKAGAAKYTFGGVTEDFDETLTLYRR